MRTVQYTTEGLVNLFQKKRVLTLAMIKQVLGTTVKMTAFRKLKTLSYRTSYSHCGKYYTLDEIARYDEYRLWSFNRIHFSRNGSLIKTIQGLIDSAESGYFASELKRTLKVRVQDALFKLHCSQKVNRQQIGGEYLYLSADKWQDQLERRKQLIEAKEKEKGLYFQSGFDSPEVRGCLQLFLSMLNEKQRRLYVGFESMKLGRSGDLILSRITDMNVKTIARGRKELLSHDISPDRIRREGAGRPAIKKTEVLKAIEKLMEDDTAGSPMGGLKWSRKSTYTVSEELSSINICISPKTTGKLLKDMKYSMRSNRKTIAETQHPDRNQQFEIIAYMK
ncbi:MAG: hypothetical protein FVQ80_18435, partial [Planctomycetes bacterium]|nr:hypothetical protein [Planctomycetota bacterium]